MPLINKDADILQQPWKSPRIHIASPANAMHAHMSVGIVHDLPYLDMLSELDRLKQRRALRVTVLRHSPGGLDLSSV